MKQIKFENFKEVVFDIIDKYESLSDEFGDVSIVAQYDEANEIIKELICAGYDIVSIELHKEDIYAYLNEYVVSLNSDGIWCEKFKRENGYFNNDSNVIYIMDNCSSKVIPYCKSDFIYEVAVENSADNDETFVEYSKGNDGDMHGFTVSKSDDNGHYSYSYYTSEQLSQKDIQDMMKTFRFLLCE